MTTSLCRQFPKILPEPYFSTTSSLLGTLRSSEEMLSTMEERQRRLLEAEESRRGAPGV